MIRIKLPTNDHESRNCKTTSGLEFHKKVFGLATVFDGVRVEALACAARMSTEAKQEGKHLVIPAAPSSGAAFTHVSASSK